MIKKGNLIYRACMVCCCCGCCCVPYGSTRGCWSTEEEVSSWMDVRAMCRFSGSPQHLLRLENRLASRARNFFTTTLPLILFLSPPPFPSPSLFLCLCLSCSRVSPFVFSPLFFLLYAGANGSQVTQVQFRLAGGGTIARRFWLKDRVSLLFQFVRTTVSWGGGSPRRWGGGKSVMKSLTVATAVLRVELAL